MTPKQLAQLKQAAIKTQGDFGHERHMVVPARTILDLIAEVERLRSFREAARQRDAAWETKWWAQYDGEVSR